MRFYTNIRFALGVAALAAMSSQGAPASAANISNLNPLYTGSWHSTTLASQELVIVQLSVSSTSSKGTFSGIFGSVRINGKVSSAGKIIFSGSGVVEDKSQPLGDVADAQITKGKAQLSTTGRFIVGSFTYSGTGELAARSGNYIFSVDSSPQEARSVAASASVTGVAPIYDGFAHHSTRSSQENVPFFWKTGTTASTGSLTAVVGDVPIKGRVSSTGAIKFKGKLNFGSGSYKVNGKAQLSATGRFLLGEMKVKGTGDGASSTGLTMFKSSSDVAPDASNAGSGTR